MKQIINQSNFNEIFDNTYLNTLKFITIKCFNINDVNDILQDTYLEILNKLKKEHQIEVYDINSYICGISSNIIKIYYYKRKNKNEDLLINIDDFDLPSNYDLENIVINKYKFKKIWKYLKNKDLLTIKIFHLFFIFDMKIVDISKTLGISESNVKHRLYRTLNEIKKKFNKESF